MKVLHILNEILPSGAETMLRLAAPSWIQHGVELHALSVGSVVGTFAPSLEEAGFQIHHLPLVPANRFVPLFVKHLRQGRYDVVHIHPERANVMFAVLARVVVRAGVVRTVHNNFAFAGRLGLERRIQRALLRSLGVIHVSVGESVAATETRHFGNRTVLVHNMFDEARFRPPTREERRIAREMLGLGPSEFAVLIIGNCSAVKNHHAVFEALALTGIPEFRVLHAGLEVEDLMGERALIDRLGLTGHVSFLGFVADVPKLLHAADCFAMPSLYEGFSVSALEMLGGGLPSVLADVPGLRDLKRHAPGAWWVPPEASVIAAALEEIAALGAEERRARAEATARMIRESFGVSQHVDKYLRIYRRVRRS